jgi:histidinol-phosphatase (PHP family)
VEQVGLNYAKALENNIMPAGITQLYCLAPTTDKSKLHDERFQTVCWERIPIEAIKAHPFFQA